MTRDTEPPAIEITSPENNETVETRTITVSGTVSDATLYDVKVNGVPAEIDGETFSADIALDNEGPNTVTAVARDCVGYSSQHAITVIRDLPVNVTITDVLFSPLSTEELLRVTVFGTVDEPVVYILGKNETYPVYRQGDQTFTNQVVGESAGGTFTIGGLVVFPGINILSVKARDAKDRSGEAEVVVEVAAEEGAYGEGQNPEPPYCILSVSVGGEGGEGGGEKLAGGESFMTFGALAGNGGQATLTIEESSDDINVFVATDLRFTAQASACNAEIMSATLDLSNCGGHLKIFKNGNGNESATVSKNLSPFEGFWWDVDAASVGHWEKVRANATLQDVTTGAPISAGPSNPFSGNNDAVTGVSLEVPGSPYGGWMLPYQPGVGTSQVLTSNGAPGSVGVKAKATTALGILTDQVSWLRNGQFAGQGHELAWDLMTPDPAYGVIAFGDANGNQKPDTDAYESASTINVDAGYGRVIGCRLEPPPEPPSEHFRVYVGGQGTAWVDLEDFTEIAPLPEVQGWYLLPVDVPAGLSPWDIIEIQGGHNHGDCTSVTLTGISPGTVTLLAAIQPTEEFLPPGTLYPPAWCFLLAATPEVGKPQEPVMRLEIRDGLDGWGGGGEVIGEEKMTRGAFTIADLNDTDGDERIDAEDDEVPGEKDLFRIVIHRPRRAGLTGKVRLVVTGPKALIWKSSDKKAGKEAQVPPEYDIETIPEKGIERWVEGLEPSKELRDVQLRIENNGVMLDEARATFIWVQLRDVLHDCKNTLWRDTGEETKEAVTRAGGLGLAPRPASGSAVTNVIAFKWRALPVGVGRPGTNSENVKFDGARQIATRLWEIVGLNVREYKKPPMPIQWPKGDEVVNDDPEDAGESNTPNADGHLFSDDSPAVEVKQVTRDDLEAGLWIVKALGVVRLVQDVRC